MVASKKKQKREQAKKEKEEEKVKIQKRIKKSRQVEPKTPNQAQYLDLLKNYNMVFCTGPAGTGKTWLAIYVATQKLLKGDVKKIILCRPAVEAGERFGFLPGDMKEKIDPYLQPAYDALYSFLGKIKVEELIEKGIIIISPLAFMRGRTFNDAFIILDEAQNVTKSQMKMFLTRMGHGSTMVINGDRTQTDLRHSESGLIHAIELLNNIPEIKVFEMSGGDIVRHPLVKKIIYAYDEHEKEQDIKNSRSKNGS